LILAFVVFNPGDLYYLGYKIIIIIIIIGNQSCKQDYFCKRNIKIKTGVLETQTETTTL